MTISKFRAWDKQAKKMKNVEAINLSNQQVVLSEKALLEMGGMWSVCDMPTSLDDVILMQSTGLVDKNGVEIFEGDVVQFEDCYIESDFLYINKGIVEWSQGRFTVTNRDSVEMEDLLDGELLDVTIIGNIYENPELMEDNA